MEFKTPIKRITSDVWANVRLKGILRILKRVKNKKILDIGCETSTYIGECFIKNNEVTFTDLLKESIEKIKYENCKTAIFDLTKKNKLPKEYYDIIICADVLEHIEEEDKALKNIYKLLKKGGYLIFTSPTYSKHYGTHDKEIGHFRRYDKKDIIRISKDYNLKLKKQRYLVSFMLPFFIFAQKSKKSKGIYKGESKIEPRIKPLLNIICFIDEFLNLPFGITIMGIYKK